MTTHSEMAKLPGKARLVVRGHVYEDFSQGRVFAHWQKRTILESDNSLFTTLTMHYNPCYLDREHARRVGYRDIPINALLVFNLVFGISVEDLGEGGGPFLGVEALQYFEPVYAGDTIRAQSEVISARLSDKRENYGIITWSTEGFNQSNQKVIEFQRTNLVKRKR